MGNLMQNLGSCYLWQGELEKSKNLLDQAMQQPNEYPEAAKYTMGNIYLAMQENEPALELHSEALEIYKRKRGLNHPTTADSCHKVGSILAMKGFARRDLVRAE